MYWILYYHLAVSVFLLQVTINIALNWRLFVAPAPRKRGNQGGDPLVSVLVPARNEARRIESCLRSLIQSDYPNYEVLVLDDHSEDGTADVVAGLGFTRDPASSRRLLDGLPLPEGWTGKSWACHQLSTAARGDYLLFTDADTVHDPAALGAFVRHAQDTGAGLLSAWPRQVTGTWSEHAVIPLVYVLLLGALPHWMLVRLQTRQEYARLASKAWLATLGAANGQFMLFSREIYHRVGGHAAIRAHLVEDVALARLIAARTAEGIRLVNCDGSRLVSCRMYGSFSEVWDGFTKNLRAAFSESAAAFWLFGVLEFSGLLMPFVFAALPWLSGKWWWIPMLQSVWILLLRAALALRFRTSWSGVWLHPVGQGLSLIIGLNSWRLSARKGVTWKGRVYRMADGEAGAIPVPETGEPAKVTPESG